MPSFQYSSFLSYRHGQGLIKQRFIEEFHRGFSAELELLRNEKAYVDMERLKGGDFYNDALAAAMYNSATMIVVYQPNYFDWQHLYCAREYRGMRSLEAHRLALLPNAEDRNHGLIIPVILRGAATLPSEVVALRQYEDFSQFMLVDDELAKHPQYAPKLKAIAEYVDARCRCLEAGEISFDGGDGFQLPNADETGEWVRNLRLPRAQFPGVGGH